MANVERDHISVVDWPDTTPTHSHFLDSVRTSTQAPLTYPSASNFSRSLTFAKYDVINYRSSLDAINLAEADQYNLSNFLESGAVDHNGEVIRTCENICDWIRTHIFRTFGRTTCNNLRARPEEELDLEQPQAPALETSPCKFPDVGIYYYERSKRYWLLQIKVDTGGYESTVMKLAQGIADQLVWQRDCNDAITACSGLYFPTFSRGQCIVAIELKWDDSNLVCNVSSSVILLTQLQDCIQRLVCAELDKVPTLSSSTPRTHKVPLTQEYVVEKFGANAYHTKAGESIVIINIFKKEVCKCPLISANRARLEELLRVQSLHASSTQFLIPHAKFDRRFFVCQLLKLPLEAQVVRHEHVLTVYMQSVVAALTEHNIAHLDVRLQNICFDEANRADGSKEADQPIFAVTRRRLLMYSYFEGWTYKRWDWRQLGLLLARILQPVRSAAEYHTKEPDFTDPLLEHAFLRKLYCDGIVHGIFR